MLFKIGKRKPFVQSSPEDWKRRWQSLVPEDCRDVPIGCGDRSTKRLRAAVKATRPRS